jgi:hypothetical protein
MSVVEGVYLLCTVSCAACAVYSWYGYRNRLNPFCFWIGLCFGFLTFSNILMYLDLVVFNSVDLLTIRNTFTLVGLGTLIFGLVREQA